MISAVVASVRVQVEGKTTRKYITTLGLPWVRRFEEAGHCKVNFRRNRGTIDLHRSIKAVYQQKAGA